MIAPASQPPEQGGQRAAADGDQPGPAEPRVDHPVRTVPTASFAHASEAEMSRILDFYGVAWRYEPTTFPILWNLEGDVVESFSPDFYLPEFDLYLEMTTLKQSLVRKKNRKLRRLRELYPDVRIKLFYARDFRAMMLKYGRLGLAESLTGTSGQLVAGVPAGDMASGSTEAASVPTSDDDGLPPPVVVAEPAMPIAPRRRRDRDGNRRGADVEIA